MAQRTIVGEPKLMRATRHGVTLVELLVVFAILSVLIGLLLPAIQASREAARRTVCQNNIRQLHMAVALYHEVHKRAPGPAVHGEIGGWSFDILPFLEAGNLHDEYLVGTSVDEAPESLRRQPLIMRCPSRVSQNGDGRHVYDTHFVFDRLGRDVGRLSDAPIDLQVPWLNGPEMKLEKIKMSVGPHNRGFHITRGDGSVELMTVGELIR